MLVVSFECPTNNDANFSAPRRLSQVLFFAVTVSIPNVNDLVLLRKYLLASGGKQKEFLYSVSCFNRRKVFEKKETRSRKLLTIVSQNGHRD